MVVSGVRGQDMRRRGRSWLLSNDGDAFYDGYRCNFRSDGRLLPLSRTNGKEPTNRNESGEGRQGAGAKCG